MSNSSSAENTHDNLKAVSVNHEPQGKHYIIPLGYRKMENLHIVFWLFKDLSWCIGLKWVAGIMIIPTLAISLIITYRTKQLMSELCHNLAISIWIVANSMWMISEFFKVDEKIAFAGITYKHLAIFPFSLGLLILAFYYLWWKPKNKHALDTL
jgi:hypothetical protein